MSARWQQWVPFHIDRFMGSASVRAMERTCRWGYWMLLCRAWQSEDCTVSADPLDLAQDSDLGDDLKVNFLSPVEGEQVSMRSVPEYQGPASGEGRMATLGQIEKRISDINDMQRAAERTAKTTGAQMSAEQALGLESEAGKLRDILYREIGKRTGVDPSAIRDIRQSYGQQFNIADTIDAARRARLGQTGASGEMGSSVPFSKTGILESGLRRIRGGQDYIANARLRDALKALQPEAQQYPTANPPAPAGAPIRQPMWAGIEPGRPELPKIDPDTFGADRLSENIRQRNATRDAAAAANRAAAQQEVLHSQSLDNAAQNASATRSSQASGVRDMLRSTAEQENQRLAEANRAAARQEVEHSANLNNAAQDASSSRASRAAGLRDMKQKLVAAQAKFEGETLRTGARRRGLSGGSGSGPGSPQ